MSTGGRERREEEAVRLVMRRREKKMLEGKAVLGPSGDGEVMERRWRDDAKKRKEVGRIWEIQKISFSFSALFFSGGKEEGGKGRRPEGGGAEGATRWVERPLPCSGCLASF